MSNFSGGLFVQNLCNACGKLSAYFPTLPNLGIKPVVFTRVLRPQSPTFSATILARPSLFSRLLSTVSTSPIRTSAKYT